MSKTILLVDDNKQSRSIYRAKLQERGYSVEEAENGIECLKKLKELVPDLIILDLMMPILDGFKVLQMVKTDPSIKNIPIIVLSGKGQPAEVEKALKLGASGFLIKMRTNPNILLDKVKETLAQAGDQVTVPRYLLSIKEQVYDAPKIINDFNLPSGYRCPECENPLLLELLPDFSHDEPWFTGHFICSVCR